MLCIVPIDPPVLAEHQPALRRAVQNWQSAPAAQQLLLDWRQGRYTDECHAFLEATLPGPFDEVVEVVYEVLNHGGPRAGSEEEHLALTVRKACPGSALAWAMGSERWALLPGWFGDYALSPDEVVAALPAVERAFSWTTAERRLVERRLETALRGEQTSAEVTALLDGVVEVWRAAVRARRALLGAHIIPS